MFKFTVTVSFCIHVKAVIQQLCGCLHSVSAVGCKHPDACLHFALYNAVQTHTHFGSSNLGANSIAGHWHLSVNCICLNIIKSICFVQSREEYKLESLPGVHVSGSSQADVSVSDLLLGGCSLKHPTGRRCIAGSSCPPWKHQQSTKEQFKRRS